MDLVHIERMNSLTEKIITLRSDAEERAQRPAHPRQGAWRHEYNIEALKARADQLERKRLALFRLRPKV